MISLLKSWICFCSDCKIIDMNLGVSIQFSTWNIAKFVQKKWLWKLCGSNLVTTKKKENLLWRNRSDAHKLVIESHFEMIQSNMKSKRSKCKRSSLSSVWWAIEECVGLTGVIEIFTLVYFCCWHVSIYVLTSKYIAMSKHNQRRIPKIDDVHMNQFFNFNFDTIKTN